MTPSPHIILALDLPDATRIPAVAQSMPDPIRWYKVGLELFCREGPAALTYLQSRHARIFLDLKLHDIPRTVAQAVRACAALGIDLLTLHASGGRAMLEAAAEAAAACGEKRPRLLAVTVLTSLDAHDLNELGVTRSLSDHALALARLAMDAGIDGLVCSPHEAAALRAALGPAPLLVTPGIRLPGGAVGDQKRIATPGWAAKQGATHLVVGRAILDAPDPRAAAEAVLADLAAP